MEKSLVSYNETRFRTLIYNFFIGYHVSNTELYPVQLDAATKATIASLFPRNLYNHVWNGN